MGSIQKNPPGKTLFCLVKIEKVKGCSSIHQKVTRTAWLYEHVLCTISGWVVQVQLWWWPFDHPKKSLSLPVSQWKFQGGQCLQKHTDYTKYELGDMYTSGSSNDHSYLYGSRPSTFFFRDSPVYPHQNNEELKGLKMGKDDNLFCLHSNLLG